MNFNKIIDLIYPETCPVCGKVKAYNDKEGVCDDCLPKLIRVDEPVCMRCGKMISEEDEEFCTDCVKIPKCFEHNYAVFSYEGIIKDSIYAFKYKNQRNYASFYANSIFEKYGTRLMKLNLDGIVPVPVHKKKLKERGYNQAELLAVELGRMLSVAVFPDYIVRTEATSPQKELNDKARMKNLKNAFNIGQNEVKLNKVLLVDDIYTSGATMNACTRLLLMSGISQVYCVTVAIGRGY